MFQQRSASQTSSFMSNPTKARNTNHCMPRLHFGSYIALNSLNADLWDTFERLTYHFSHAIAKSSRCSRSVLQHCPPIDTEASSAGELHRYYDWNAYESLRTLKQAI